VINISSLHIYYHKLRFTEYFLPFSFFILTKGSKYLILTFVILNFCNLLFFNNNIDLFCLYIFMLIHGYALIMTSSYNKFLAETQRVNLRVTIDCS